MREIKFRAWIKDYSLMTDVNFLNIDYKEIVVMIDENDYEFGCGEYELMQYTGLKDKNGTEIYEGDIVKITNPFAEDIISKVVWGGTEYPAFDLPKYDGDTMNAFSAIRFNGDDQMEVIGNIFEHPHLLEGDN